MATVDNEKNVDALKGLGITFSSFYLEKSGHKL
jgi:hypothetical protein